MQHVVLIFLDLWLGNIQNLVSIALLCEVIKSDFLIEKIRFLKHNFKFNFRSNFWLAKGINFKANFRSDCF